MRGAAHAQIGATVGCLVSLASQQHVWLPGTLDILPAVGAGLGAVAGLLPDIDTPGGEIHSVPRRISQFARSLVSTRTRKLIPLLPRIPHIHLGEHRGPTHSLAAGAGIAGLVLALDHLAAPRLAWVLALVIFAAYASHLVADLPNYTPMRFFWWPLTIWFPALRERPAWLPAVYLNSWRGRLVEVGAQLACLVAFYLILPASIHQAVWAAVVGVVRW